MQQSVAASSLLALCLLVGCAHQPRAPTDTAQVTQPAPPAPQPPAPAAPQSSAAPTPRSASAPEPRAASAAPSAAPRAPRNTNPGHAAGTSGTKTAAAPAPAKATPNPAQPTLDLRTLEERLKSTPAIGLFTKLSLKNQVDDLLAQFREFHHASNTHTVPELRQRYDLLLMKVLSLLQNGDPTLAATVSSSREALWALLIDPKAFAKLSA